MSTSSMELLEVPNGTAVRHGDEDVAKDHGIAEENQAFIMEIQSKQVQERMRKLSSIVMAYENEIPSAKPDEDNSKTTYGEHEVDKAQRLNDAVLNGDYVLANKLVQDKQYLNNPDRYGRSPLQNAVVKSDIRMVKLLLDARPDITHKDDRGDTIMQCAARTGNEAILKVTRDTIQSTCC
ncbi:predicted protein [Nematostella vectensis]|uniref:Uncharacterized protein n=1 Tax=Nematostella vectensis TaxID=45351 RepID=A7SDG0_NEMVE|nr:predicted protein [Nematostella vectensis]|eukprot:XP_001630318.1 predicted protein [Nematostella vectensis]